MSIKDYNKCINVINATTGDIIEIILLRNHSYNTIYNMINDIVLEDFNNNQHGILLKYGIKQ